MHIVFSGDPYAMNWLRSDYPYAHVRTPAPIHGDSLTSDIVTDAVTERDGDLVRTLVTITNTGSKPYFSKTGDLGITLPLEDRYDKDEDQQTQRCNTHLFCGGTSSYVLALRMGGEAPHLGLVLTQGSLTSYSIERDTELQSNDRGCFILHPTPFVLQPGERTTVAWTIFPCSGKDDFFIQARKHTRFVQASWSDYVLLPGQTSTLEVQPSFDAKVVAVNGRQIHKDEDGRYRFTLEASASEPGEKTLVVTADEQSVRTRILVKAPFEALLERRCSFIARQQQYHGPVEGLDGAYLIYDNESERIYYNHLNDYNAGRERIGMGVLMAQYLAAVRDGVVGVSREGILDELRLSLDRFSAYVRRELVDVETGQVFNDFQRDGSLSRLYNSPWIASFFLKLFQLDGDVEDLDIAWRVVRRFYDEGGIDFYPIELPVLELCDALAEAGRDWQLADARAIFTSHARRIAATGSSFPPFEVNYEQSIVAPSLDILLQVHLITGDAELLDAGRAQLKILDQFQGMQPDYHLNEVAVRHWDGFWFGKRRMYGDTFPHYWSGLTGNVYSLYAQATGDGEYDKRADVALRGVLPLVFDDGRATCAFLFPYSVNGERAEYYDPYANDQDWGLVFSLRRLTTPVNRDHRVPGAQVSHAIQVEI